MANLGEEEVVPAQNTGGITQDQLSLLGQLQSKSPVAPVTVNDFSSTIPSEGALNPTDYYPGLNHQIGVGTTAGREIGSHTIYAPGGGLVPLGMLDAREAAIRKAALAKQLEEVNFMKQHQAPTTKHVAVQPELTKQYYDFLGNSMNRAKKMYGKNWVAGLQTDPDFNRANQNFQDLSKFHTAIVDHAAQLDLMDKDPNMVVSPQTKRMSNDLLSAVAYKGQNPFSNEAQDIGKKYLGAKAMADLDVTVNKAIDKMTPELEQMPLTFQQRGTHELATELEKEYFSPEKQKQLAKDVWNQEYKGTDITEEQVLKHIQSLQPEKIKRKVAAYQNMFPPRENKEEDYTNAIPQKQATFNQTVMPEAGNQKQAQKFAQTKPVYVEQSFNTTAKDQQKELSFTISNKMKDLEGTPLHEESGYIKGQVQQMASMPYYAKGKRFLTPEEATKLKKAGTLYGNKDIEWQAGAIVNVTPKTDEKGKIGKSRSVVIPAEDITGKLGKGFDGVIDQVKTDVDAKNEANKQAAIRHAEKAVTPAKTDYSKDIQSKIEKVMKANPGASEEDVIAAMKKAGHIK